MYTNEVFRFTQSNVKFGPSFVGNHQMSREMWLFNHKIQAGNFGQLRIFGNIKCQETVIKLINFVRISNYNQNGKVERTSFSKQLVQRSQKNSQPTKIN